MSRYIEEDALLAKVSRMIDYCEKDPKVSALSALFSVGDAIMDCPTADVVEVRHGEWGDVVELNVANGKYQHPCGACGKSYFDNNKFNHLFCPNCGAKMDGKRRKHDATD